MITTHSEKETRVIISKNIKKRYDILANLVTILNNIKKSTLAFPEIICDYNKNMGNFDRNA